LPFRRIEPGIAAVWGWDNRSHQRCNHEQTSRRTIEDSEGIILLRQFFRIVTSFPFPRYMNLMAGPEETKNLAGKVVQPDSDPLSGSECGKN
jgi:hypothetical protein